MPASLLAHLFCALLFQETAQDFAERGTLLFNLSNEVMMKGNFPLYQDLLRLSLNQYERSEGLAPNKEHFKVNSATVLAKLGDYPGAIEKLKKALTGSKWKEMDIGTQAWGLADLGCSLELSGKIDEAKSFYEQAIQLRPHFKHEYIPDFLEKCRRNDRLRAGGTKTVLMSESMSGNIWWTEVTLFVVLAAIVAWLVVLSTSGLNRFQSIAFICSSALAFALAATVFLPEQSQAEINIPSMGLKMAGGAAVGMAATMIAWKLSTIRSAFTVVQCPEYPAGGQTLAPKSGLRRVMEVHKEEPRGCVLVEFMEGFDKGAFVVSWSTSIDPARQGEVHYSVSRQGTIQKQS